MDDFILSLIKKYVTGSLKNLSTLFVSICLTFDYLQF